MNCKLKYLLCGSFSIIIFSIILSLLSIMSYTLSYLNHLEFNKVDCHTNSSVADIVCGKNNICLMSGEITGIFDQIPPINYTLINYDNHVPTSCPPEFDYYLDKLSIYRDNIAYALVWLIISAVMVFVILSLIIIVIFIKCFVD